MLCGHWPRPRKCQMQKWFECDCGKFHIGFQPSGKFHDNAFVFLACGSPPVCDLEKLRAPRRKSMFHFLFRSSFVIGGYARKINAEKCILHLLHDPTFFALYPTRPESSFGALQREFKKNICSSHIHHFLLTRITLLHNPRHCFLVSFERS